MVSEAASAAVYRRLYSTSVINAVSDAVAGLAVPLAFYARTGSVALAASLASATLLPQLFLAVPLGALGDRLPRRLLVINSYVCEAVCMAVLAALLHLHHSPHLWMVVLIGVVRGCASELGVAASAGYATQVLGRDALLRYRSRVETIEGVASIVGPPVAGAMVTLCGAPIGVLVPAVLSVVSCGLFLALPDAPRPEVRRGTSRVRMPLEVLRDSAEGVIYAVRHPVLLAMLAVQVALGATTASYVFAVVTHLREGMALSGTAVGVIMTATGLGGICGSLLWEKLVPVERAPWLLAGSLTAVAVLLVAFPHNGSPVLATVALFLLDLFWVALFIYGGTLEQYVSENRMLARVSALSGTLFVLSATVANAAAARWITSVGVSRLMVGVAATCVPAIILLAWMIASRQRIVAADQ